MVKMQAVQSALAVRRQRSRREEAKQAQQRKGSRASVLSTPRSSIVSLDGRVYFDEKSKNKRMFGQVTMFHVGGVLILIGLLLVITSLMPSYAKTTTAEKRNDLLGTGSFFVFIGGVLTTISRFVSNNEEKELNQYIRGQLSKSRSAHRLRDLEIGMPTPTKERKSKSTQNGFSDIAQTHSSKGVNTADSTLHHQRDYISNTTPSVSSEYISVDLDSSGTQFGSTELVLSQILEEDEMEVETDATTEPIDDSSFTPDSSLSPTSPLETQGLLGRHQTTSIIAKNSVKNKPIKLSS